MNANILKDYDRYSEFPSCKLESLVEILRHHLAADGASGARPSRERMPESFYSTRASPWTPRESAQPSSQVVAAPLPRPPAERNGAPDKIIIYSFFASSFDLITMVSWERRCGPRR